MHPGGIRSDTHLFYFEKSANLKHPNVHPTENASDPRGFCEKKQTVLSFGNAGGQRQQGLRRESGEGQGIERELSQDRSFR